MLREVRVDGGKASVAIRLTTPLCPSREEIRSAVNAAALAVAGVKEVEVEFTADVARKFGPKAERLPGVRNVIAVAAGKGGVGKSTVATNLAAALAMQGTAVGIMDADVFGPSIPQMMGPPEVETGVGENTITPAVHHGIKVVSVGFFVERGAAIMWRGPMIHKLITQFVEDVAWGELDYLVVDLPPWNRRHAALACAARARDWRGHGHHPARGFGHRRREGSRYVEEGRGAGARHHREHELLRLPQVWPP